MSEYENTTFRIGPIRPPSEANSLLLQITKGCTWNKCKFCCLYRNTKFQAYSVESIKQDIDVIAYYASLVEEQRNADGTIDRLKLSRVIQSLSQEEQNSFYVVYNWIMHGCESVFLQDGNSLALKPDRVVEVLLYLRSKFPQIKRVTTYARAETLARITEEEFKALRAAGLDRIHSGFESGSDEVLAFINKGVTAEQEIQAGKRIKAAGIQFSVYFMPGIGGKALSRQNAIETARVVREINPDFVRMRTSVVVKRTQLWEEYEKGEFQLCSDNEKLEEIRTLIENTGECTGYLASDHIINLLQNIEGRLDADHDKMLSIIDEYFALPELEQKMYQLARRQGMVSAVSDMAKLPGPQRTELEGICRSVTDEAEWNDLMNQLMRRYI